MHQAVIVATTWIDNDRTGEFSPGEEVEIAFTFDNVLAPGRYTPVFQLAHRGSGLDMIDRFEGGFSFVVTGPQALGGLVDLPVRSGMSRVGAPPGAAHTSMSVQAPPYESLGRPIHGPGALTGDWRRFWHLT